MAERVTTEALTRYTETLRPHLSEALADELSRLAEAADGVPSWQEGSAWLSEHGFSALSGQGPMPKVLRAVAYTLERLAEELPAAGKDIQATRIRISNTVSGCSSYAGLIEVRGQRDGAEVVVLDGRFIWDCAAWDMPSAAAAQTRGYACMVEFPRPTFAAVP